MDVIQYVLFALRDSIDTSCPALLDCNNKELQVFHHRTRYAELRNIWQLFFLCVDRRIRKPIHLYNTGQCMLHSNHLQRLQEPVLPQMRLSSRTIFLCLTNTLASSSSFPLQPSHMLHTSRMQRLNIHTCYRILHRIALTLHIQMSTAMNCSVYRTTSHRNPRDCYKFDLYIIHHICLCCTSMTCTSMTCCMIDRCSACLGMRKHLCRKLQFVSKRAMNHLSQRAFPGNLHSPMQTLCCSS